ncbi:hypothetical protein D3C85_1786970 [compost metagenome]
MQAQHLINLPAHLLHRIQRRHGLLKHHGNPGSAQGAEPVRRSPQHIVIAEHNAACRRGKHAFGQ